MLFYATKITGTLAVLAVGELAAHGQIALALAIGFVLVLMWHATRQHARRRARTGGPR